MTDLKSRAQSLLDMHHTGKMLVLPTVWDVWSAKTCVDAGFTALTIGSHPLADSLGKADNEGMKFEEALAGIARICDAVDVPVSADVESGYGQSATVLVQRVLEVGAVGVNVEDTVHSEDRVRSREEQAEYIHAIRQAADEADVPLVINGRTDAFIHGTEVFTDPLQETIARLQAMEKAGARSLYPVRLPDMASLKQILAAVSLPVNITASPSTGAPPGSMAELREAGVKRISYGPNLQKKLTESMTSLISGWL